MFVQSHWLLEDISECQKKLSLLIILTQSHLLNIPLHCSWCYRSVSHQTSQTPNFNSSKMRRRKVCHNNMKKRINIRSCSAILRCQSSTKSHPDSGRPRVIQRVFCQVAAKHRKQWSSPNMFASPSTPAPSCTLNFWLQLASKSCFRNMQELTTRKKTDLWRTCSKTRQTTDAQSAARNILGWIPEHVCKAIAAAILKSGTGSREIQWN